MGRLSQRCIEDIRDRVDIVTVVERVVTLKRAGSEYRGLSPFTNERTPSFFVNPAKNFFYCFSSSTGGDIFKFVMLTEGLSFAEAAEALAQRHGIPLDYEEGSGPDSSSRSLRREILDLHEHVADAFHRAFLSQNEMAAQVRRYWTEDRRFPLSLAEEFRIGFAPPQDGTRLGEKLAKAGFSLEALNQSGIFRYRENLKHPSQLRPFFRGRLMIPIREALQGEIIAFTARKLFCTPTDDSSHEAKYINTRETPAFRKSETLFNLDRARHHLDKGQKPFLLVEGQLDALRCWEKGLQTAIAPQGTSITEGQISRLKRYSQRLEVLLDGDSAGQRAALRILPMALQQEIELSFLCLPEGEDPDSLLAAKGSDGLDELRRNALPAMRFAARAALPPDSSSSPQARAAAMRKLFEIIAHSPSHVARQAYLEEAAHTLGIPADAAERDFRNFLTRKAPAPPLTPPVTEESRMLTNSSSDLLCLILAQPELLAKISEIIDIEWVDQSFTEGRLLARMIAELREGLWESLKFFTDQIDDEAETNALFALQARPAQFPDPIRAANEALQGLYRTYLRKQSETLRNRELNLPPNSPEQIALARERIRLNGLKIKTLPVIQP